MKSWIEMNELMGLFEEIQRKRNWKLRLLWRGGHSWTHGVRVWVVDAQIRETSLKLGIILTVENLVPTILNKKDNWNHIQGMFKSISGKALDGV